MMAEQPTMAIKANNTKTATESKNVQDLSPMTQEEDQILGHSQQISNRKPQEDTTGGTPMESTPKNWVMKPLSPKLEPIHLRTMLSSTNDQDKGWAYSKSEESNGFSHENTAVVTSPLGNRVHDLMAQVRRVSVSEQGNDASDGSPSSPSSTSSKGSHSGFYSFVDEQKSPEAERTEAWMLSAVRQAKMATLREENSFKLRAYVEERKPEKLFQESNGDTPYQIADAPGTEPQEEEQVQARLEIIRSQAPKKNTSSTGHCSALDNMDFSNSPHRLIEGFSLCYYPTGADREHTGAETGTIDTEKISFSAARQQFLKMEQTKNNPFLQSPQQLLQTPKHQGHPSQNDGGMVISRRGNDDVFSEEQSSKRQTSGENQDKVFSRNWEIVYTSEEKGIARQSSCYESFNSGFSNMSLDASGDNVFDSSGSDKVSEAGCAAETPIEKEIRIAQEREETLRRERGIKHTDVKEMVEIKTKPLLSQASSSMSLAKAKDKNRVSFFIQREIERENQREEDLQHQGKVPGLYDRGKAQELEDRKRVFELQADEVPVMPTKTSLTGNLVDAMQARTPDEGAGRTLQDTVSVENESNSDILSPCCPHRHPDETLNFRNISGNPATKSRIQGFAPALPQKSSVTDSEENKSAISQATTASGSAIASNRFSDVPRQGANNRSASARGPSSAKSSSSYASPPSTPVDSPLLGPSLSGRPVVRQSEHKEQFSLRLRQVHTPEAIRREIEWDMRREEELRVLREASRQSLSRNGALDEVDRTAVLADTTEAGSLKNSIEDNTSPPWDAREEAVKRADLVSAAAEARRSRYSTLSFSPAGDPQETSQIQPASKPGTLSTTVIPSRSPRLAISSPSVSIVTAQPWSSTQPSSPALTKAAVVRPQILRADTGAATMQKGLTETLLEDFEERRIKLKLEENAYAGIQPIDDVNNEVLEATRVTRHKNTRALRWEAGMYANAEGN